MRTPTESYSIKLSNCYLNAVWRVFKWHLFAFDLIDICSPRSKCFGYECVGTMCINNHLRVKRKIFVWEILFTFRFAILCVIKSTFRYAFYDFSF